MAIIYTYPNATPKATDKLIGTVTEDTGAVNVVKGNPTRSFTISALQTLFNEDVVSTVVTIQPAVFKTLTSTNFLTILEAPGAGKAYDIQGINIYVNAGTIKFTATAAPYFYGPFDTGSNADIPYATVINADVSTDVLYKISSNISDQDYIMSQNTALELRTAQVAETTAGNGIIYVNITYKIVNTSATMV